MNKRLLVVTGASKGIGLATAKVFQDMGFEVVNLSRTECSLQGVVNIQINLAEKDWPQRALDSLREMAQSAEQICLLHNAAIMTKESVDSVQAPNLRDALELNVIAAARLNVYLLPYMKTGSSILYIGSTLGTKAVANTYNYVISKHAVIGQMKATCQDLAGKGIHTACVCPGFTETEMLKEHIGKHPEILPQITDTVAMGRLISPKEIAQTIAFCCDNPVINGAVIDANLGQIER